MGDLCNQLGASNSAEKAFNQVLGIAKPKIDDRLVANANRQMAEIMTERGQVEQAKTMRQNGQEMYGQLGLGAELSAEEREAGNMIRSGDLTKDMQFENLKTALFMSVDGENSMDM